MYSNYSNTFMFDLNTHRSLFLCLTRCVRSVQICHFVDELISDLEQGPQLCAGGWTTPRPRRAVRLCDAVHQQARLAHSGYIRALRSVYKPCEDGDYREECIIILHLNWT